MKTTFITHLKMPPWNTLNTSGRCCLTHRLCFKIHSKNHQSITSRNQICDDFALLRVKLYQTEVGLWLNCGSDIDRDVWISLLYVRSCTDGCYRPTHHQTQYSRNSRMKLCWPNGKGWEKDLSCSNSTGRILTGNADYNSQDKIWNLPAQWHVPGGGTEDQKYSPWKKTKRERELYV